MREVCEVSSPKEGPRRATYSVHLEKKTTQAQPSSPNPTDSLEERGDVRDLDRVR